MNKSFFAILFICNVVFSNAVFLKKTNDSKFTTLSQLREISETEFGKILDTIALQMNNQSPLADVAKMLQDILANLKAQQVNDDQSHAAYQNNCGVEQDKFTNNRDACQKNADDADDQIGVLKSEIETINTKISVLNQQTEILKRRETQTHLARQQDRIAYAKRKEQGPNVISALNLIIEQLATIKPNNIDGAFLELAKIGKENPIAALLQVASTFSKETLDSVKEKMIDLRSNIENALGADSEAEEKAEAQYKKIVGELQKTKKNVANALNEATSLLGQKKTALGLQEKRLAENTNCVTVNDGKLRQSIKDCQLEQVKYENDKAGRKKETATIEQVMQILVRNRDHMHAFLQKNGD